MITCSGTTGNWDSFDSHDDEDDKEEVYFWGCTLTKDRPIVKWSFDDENDVSDSESDEDHSLILKQAVLGVGSIPGQKNVVEVQAYNYSDELIEYPILSLTANSNDMCTMNMFFSCVGPVVFRLAAGSGPVHLTGEHHVEFYDDDDDDESDSDNDPLKPPKKKLEPAAKATKKSSKAEKLNKTEEKTTGKEKKTRKKRGPKVESLAKLWSPSLEPSVIEATFAQLVPLSSSSSLLLLKPVSSDVVSSCSEEMTPMTANGSPTGKAKEVGRKKTKAGDKDEKPTKETKQKAAKKQTTTTKTKKMKAAPED